MTLQAPSTGTTFTWEPKHEEAFVNIKKALVSPPLLDYPRKKDQFVLTTDASDSSLGAILSTARGIVIEYSSRTLSSAEKAYATTEMECLGNCLGCPQIPPLSYWCSLFVGN